MEKIFSHKDWWDDFINILNCFKNKYEEAGPGKITPFQVCGKRVVSSALEAVNGELYRQFENIFRS